MESANSSALNRVIDNVDDFIDARWRWVRKRLGWEGVPAIQPYVGYANDDRVWFHGRVLTNVPRNTPSIEDGWFENVVAMYQRLESDEVVGVTVEIDFAGKRHRVVTDEEGYFHLETSNTPDLRGKLPWQMISMRIVDSNLVTAEESTTVSRLLTPPESAQVGLISDIDDTIIHTGAANMLEMLRSTFFHNARSRKPLAGVASLYRAIASGVDHDADSQNNPVFYVSSSPWNLHDMLEDFVELNDIPDGPVLLRDLGFDQNKFLAEGHSHKLDKAKSILATWPKMPFILFGDSGQEDSVIYAELAKLYPEQVVAIFIRDVDPTSESTRDKNVATAIESIRDQKIPFHLIKDSTEAAAVLNQLGYVSSGWLPTIKSDTERDIKAES
ncbi:App1 family protein [Mariniblastus fucicola]|uniref:Phosphatidate phosphatase APP1 catalytic domain-containing protein n=1 Tax=Mariniblastus fucicola TaxID=980251 RepID=A0A5B9PIQ4_9BACT|nr:phosphatase domain-containing protein [Mariniblastus fucicola]QEG22631.1 hypothetical protein MFFC18_25140 [Mariniblastus fucicola]